MKLESLADRLPTQEDVGKMVYSAHGVATTIKKVIKDDVYLDFSRNYIVKCMHYWQKPIIVSEEEYNGLKGACIKSGNQIGKSPFGSTITLLVAGLKQDNDRLEEDNEKLKELLKRCLEHVEPFTLHKCDVECDTFGDADLCKEINEVLK